ncbi:MAG: GGDEF domain-containing protein [Defluviitaleaceae bacterium]|nr:GGDEF domain-containing protein [Defluviitaleaceae bacterium]
MIDINIQHKSFETYEVSHMHWMKSLKFRLAAYFVVIVITFSIAAAFAMYNIYWNRIVEEHNNRAATVSSMIASMLEGEHINNLLAESEEYFYYQQIVSFIHTAIQEAVATHIYIATFTIEDDEKRKTLILDGLDVDNYYCLNLLTHLEGRHSSDTWERLAQGQRVEDFGLYSDTIGVFLAIYEPIFGADGSVAAHVCFYISQNEITTQANTDFTTLSVAVAAILLAMSLGYLGVIKKNVTEPISILIDGINANQLGQENQENKVLEARLSKGDELAHLEQAIVVMVTQLRDTVLRFEQERNLANLIMDGCPLAVYMFDSKFSLVYCNDIDAKLRGFEDAQEYKDRFFDIMPEFQPDGTESVEKFKENLQKTLLDGITNVTWMDQDLDGNLIPGEITNIRVLYNGEHYIISYKKDLQDLSQMENRISVLEKKAAKIYYDELTNVLNRRHLEEQLPRTISILSRSGAMLSFMMIDIDFFKQYNDTYGHDAGDQCLKTVASTISSCMSRAKDFVVRYGGEEFAVVLPNTGMEGACKLAKKLLDSIEQCEIPHENSSVSKYVTISIGVTTGVATHVQSISDWVKCADEKLYLSKQRGRNKFTFGEFPGSATPK